MKSRYPHSCWLLVLISAVGLVGPAPAQPLDPLDFTSLGTLSLSGGDFTFDTDTLTVFDNASPGVSLFTGVVDDQNGQADYFNGNWAPGTLGIPEIAVFTFDAIDLQASANVTITGTRAIALLSRGGATIGTPLSVDGVDSSPSTTAGPGGLGGPGGFDGGSSPAAPAPQLPGQGPGGGLAHPDTTADITSESGGAGGFGGRGHTPSFSYDLSGPTYGDLSVALQGGSGGANLTTLFGNQDGAGGGGAIEINALGGLTIDAAVTARGGFGASSSAASGSGSGGGIRLVGEKVDLNAPVIAIGGDFASASVGGGGRVYVEGLIGLNGMNLGDLGVAATAAIDVKSNHANPDGSPLDGRSLANYGVITISPKTTLVESGESVTFGQAVAAPTATENYEIVLRDTRFASGSAGTVAAAGHSNAHTIELAGDTATLSGPGTLTNRRELRGTGRVEAPTINAAGGEINATNDTLLFTQSLINSSGAQINAISSTLGFDAGLDSEGEINLINSTVNGDVVNNGVVALAGTNTFTGAVSGNGAFTGSGTGAFSGSLAPGISPGLLTFEGDLVLEPTATLAIEIGGATPGVEHDRVEVGGFATLEGALDVSLVADFLPALGDSFAFLFASGSFDANFAEVNLPDLSAEGLAWQLNPGGATLFLEAVPAIDGDYNLDGTVDAADYTVWRDGLGTTFTQADYNVWASNYGAVAPAASLTAVPEPTAALLVLSALPFARRRPR